MFSYINNKSLMEDINKKNFAAENYLTELYQFCRKSKLYSPQMFNGLFKMFCEECFDLDPGNIL